MFLTEILSQNLLESCYYQIFDTKLPTFCITISKKLRGIIAILFIHISLPSEFHRCKQMQIVFASNRSSFIASKVNPVNENSFPINVYSVTESLTN